jgi:hypothetical protein
LWDEVRKWLLLAVRLEKVRLATVRLVAGRCVRVAKDGDVISAAESIMTRLARNEGKLIHLKKKDSVLALRSV